MQELEAKIAAWRVQMAAALPGQHETVEELETHLRDHLDRALASGVSPEKAFAEGVARIGDAGALVRQFELASRQRAASWPMIAIHGLVGLPAVALLVDVSLQVGRNDLYLLQGIHAMLMITGFLALLGAGLTGIWTLVSFFAKSLTDRNVSLQQRTMRHFLVAGSVVLPIGIVIGAAWPPAGGNMGDPGSQASTEIGVITVLISMSILLLLHARAIESDTPRAFLSLLGSSLVYGGWILADVRLPIPIAWLSIASVLAYGSTALLHVRRSHREKSTTIGPALN